MSVIDFKPGQLEAPETLSDDERAQWEGITRALPSEWFDAGTAPLLTSYVKHMTMARKLDEEIDKLGWPMDKIGLRRLNKLLSLRERQTSTMLSVARTLRLTQQSRYSAKKAGRLARDARSGKSPWES